MTNIKNLLLGIGYRYVFGDTMEDSNPIPEIGELPIMHKFKRKAGGVALLLGKRESGKTELAKRVAEIIGKPTYAVSPEQKPPPWITPLKMGELNHSPPAKTTLILDDLPVIMSSRDYHNPDVQIVEKLIPVVRHTRKIHLIFSTQMASMADKFVMDADMICFKPPNLLFADLERPAVAKWFKHIMPIFNRMSERQQKRHCYIISQDWKGLVRINLAQNSMPSVISEEDDEEDNEKFD